MPATVRSSGRDGGRPAALPSRRRLLTAGAGVLGLAAMGACRRAVDTAPGGGGGHLVAGQVGDILPTAPVSGTGNNTVWRGNVLQGLGRVDPRTFALHPLLATGWRVSDGGRQLTFTVRRGVTWHTGRAFGPQDVVWTFRTLAAGKRLSRPFPQAWLLKEIDDLSVRGQDVVVKLRDPVAGALQAFGDIAILDRESIDAFDQGTRWVGTGPFRVTKYQPGSSLKLARNAKYWERGHPYLRSVELQIFSRPDALLSALRTGQVQLGTSLAPRDLAGLDAGKVRVVRSPGGSGIFLGANVRVKPLDDQRVRQAIAYAVDRERIAKDVFKGYATASCAPWSEHAPSFSPQTRDHYRRDVAKAKALLKEAGYHGQEIVYEVSGASPVLGNVAQIVQRNLQEAGLKVKLVVLQSAENDARFQKTDFKGLYTAGDGNNDLPAPYLVNTNRPWTFHDNLWGFTAPEFTRLAAKATHASGDAELRSTGDELTRYMLDQAFCTELVVTASAVATVGLNGLAFSSGQQLLDDAKV